MKEVELTLVKSRPKYKVKKNRNGGKVDISGLRFVLSDPQNQFPCDGKVEMSELEKFVIANVLYPYKQTESPLAIFSPPSRFSVSILNPRVKMNERTIQVLSSLKNFIGPNIRNRSWIFKAFDLAGIDYEGDEDSEVSEEHEKIIRGLLSKARLI